MLISQRPRRKSSSRPAAPSTLHLRGRLGRYAGRHRDWPSQHEAIREDRHCRSEGAALFEYYKNGELKSSGSSITEGIGQGRITANLEGFTPDYAYQIPDSEALDIVFDLVENEGLCLGGSSGINIAGAMRLARDLGPGHTIVTILCDYGNRYQSKLFNPDFLRSKNLPVPAWLEKRADFDLPFETV